LRVRWWIAPPKRADALDARDKVLTAVKNQLTAHGIDLPFPTQQILFHDQTEGGDGDRARPREGLLRNFLRYLGNQVALGTFVSTLEQALCHLGGRQIPSADDTMTMGVCVCSPVP
jgi:hypothetical protein